MTSVPAPRPVRCDQFRKVRRSKSPNVSGSMVRTALIQSASDSSGAGGRVSG
ncbi:MAG TPA: hypothetical protein VM076_13370 [Gemmatimonadaceae bacterium]|nr:hypothetical protein [Gemmatimonadaceae bacterium]